MLTIPVSVVVAVLGQIVWAVNEKEFNLYTHWRKAVLSLAGSAAIWLIWWQVGMPIFDLEAGNFNYLVFFLPWLVPQLLQRIPTEKK